MALWGNLDNVTISGNVTIAAANGNAVLGVGTLFTTNVAAGDYITIASNKYQVDRVNSDTSLFLSANAATTSAGVRAFLQQGPKYVSNANTAIHGTNIYTIQNVVGVDRIEVNVPENKARNISHTGWTHYQTYGTTQGETRHKAEVLVAMSKNFAANLTGALFGTGAGQDASDDNVLANYLLFFLQQPTTASNTAGNPVTLVTNAATDPVGQNITFQWFFRPNANVQAYTVVNNGNGISGNTTNTLSIVNVSNVAGNIFRLTISGTNGADSNVSNAIPVSIT